MQIVLDVRLYNSSGSKVLIPQVPCSIENVLGEVTH